MYQVYGIPNCDTVKKARAWLDARGVAYAFHDYKREGVPPAMVDWIAQVGRDALVNRRGTTWRKLPEAERASADDDAGALQVMRGNPSVIRRPVVTDGQRVLAVGFGADDWARLFGGESA